MKIDDVQHVKHTIPPDLRKPKRSGGKKFDAVLQDNLKAISSERLKKAQVTEPQKATPVILPAIDREEVVARVINFLDIMDEYAQKLGNPNITLKEIAPLIAKIEDKNNELKLLAESLPPLDSMRPLLDEVLIRSSVEVIKYNRGDYM